MITKWVILLFMKNAGVSGSYEESLGYIINHLMYAFRKGIIHRCGEAGYLITHEELGALVLLGRQDGVTQTSLADTLAKDKAVITRLLNGLVRKGWVDRKSDAKDRRIVRAWLTPGGREAIRKISPLLVGYVTAAIDGIGQEEFDAACTVLRRITANLQHMSESGSR